MTTAGILEIARALTAVAGVSGRETPAAAAAQSLLAPMGRVTVSPLGSLHCTVCEGRAGAPHLLLEAHLDRIGLMVSGVTPDGFLRVASVGGFDRRLLPAAPVTIYAREGEYAGVIASVPPHLADEKDKPLKVEELAVDAGFSGEEAKKIFAPGDMVMLDSRFMELACGRAASGGMDNRIGCAAVIAAAQELHIHQPGCRVTVLLAAQEEAGGAGARTSAYALRPDAAIVVDVSFGEGFGSPAQKCGKLGAGVMVGMAPILNRTMTQRLLTLAKEGSIPCQTEVMGGGTGTDADGVAAAAGGIQTALLSIPLRNMHTVVETVDMEDVVSTARLMVEYAKEVSAH